MREVEQTGGASEVMGEGNSSNSISSDDSEAEQCMSTRSTPRKIRRRMIDHKDV